MPDRAGPERLTLHDAQQTETLLDGIARDAASWLRGRDRAALVGVLRRGAPLAARIAERLERDHGIAGLELLDLKIERYSDDLKLLHPETRLTEDPSLASLDLSGLSVLLVDDVLYHGNSLLRAIEWLEKRGPAGIRTAVLVDRDVARLPIRADTAGARLRIADGDVIECRVPPYEPELGIDLIRRSRQ